MLVSNRTERNGGMLTKRWLLSRVLVVGAVALEGSCSPAAPADLSAAGVRYDLGAARELRILYAGALDTERAAAFLAFLRANFATVEAMDLRRLDAKAAAPFDVVVADWKREWGPEGLLAKRDWPNLHLGAEFTKPVVMVAAGGCSIQQHTKIGML